MFCPEEDDDMSKSSKKTTKKSASKAAKKAGKAKSGKKAVKKGAKAGKVVRAPKGKLNTAQKTTVAALYRNSVCGLRPSLWGSAARYPTRSLTTLKARGLVKSVDKKIDGKVVTHWFPTTKLDKNREALLA